MNITDTYRVLYLRDLPKPVKHLSYDPSGTYIAASCTDGIVYIYSLSTEEPDLIRKVDGLIRSLETESVSSSRAAWHPDGRAFAAPTATRDIQVLSSGDGERQRAFAGGHLGDITALAWSPNGAMLLTASSDRKIVLWDTKTQKILARYPSIDLLGGVLALTNEQIRISKCYQHSVASLREYCLICNVRWRIVYLYEISAARSCPLARKDLTTSPVHQRPFSRDFR